MSVRKGEMRWRKKLTYPARRRFLLTPILRPVVEIHAKKLQKSEAEHDANDCGENIVIRWSRKTGGSR
jgi:hypothetical protein